MFFLVLILERIRAARQAVYSRLLRGARLGVLRMGGPTHQNRELRLAVPA